MKVSDDEEGPGFAYTIGLHRSFKRSEIIIFGLPDDIMHQLLNDTGERGFEG